MRSSTAFLLGLGCAALIMDPDALAAATELLGKLVEPVAKASAKAAVKEAKK